ncbi:MAG: DUF3795 domain-containing protein [Candidatus Lokiarchaeota archaeon]|nr:DUF3795 domain-containing protein [Candidatus Lokiarchaeota archaeon]
MIAYCGINCSECPAYLATQKDDYEELKKVAKEWSNESMSFKPEEIYCDGCNQEECIFRWCRECPIRSCCREKGFKNCAYCEDYFCDNLKMTFDKTPSAKERLDEIRKNL